MKLDAFKLGLATAIIAGLTWALCSLFIIVIPGGMMQMSGDMVHANLSGMGWSMHWAGFFVGLVAWSFISGLFVWAISATYNRLLS
ncbi:DUF5676 family membrane protein [Parasphingorhabdus sp.]|uniref:DUF5676 family membrane protein n=1 Tax=Parasphingorhabdus sp. TaxID=2709688 RepID=UPI0035942AA9